jgi:hypothetical protein
MPPGLPDPDLLRAFGRAVRAHFEDEVAKERKQAEARREAVLPSVRSAIGRARAEGLCVMPGSSARTPGESQAYAAT